jgi:RimJ/RimL family protein N-acetyltransferase
VPGAVGLAGFHGPPDGKGMVELGYRIDPRHRRHGYARAALETLLAVARDQPSVEIVRATVSPDNVASRSLIDQYGFAEVGDQWDDEDGLEIILEVAARP